MTGCPRGSPQKTPVGPSAPPTPETTAQLGSILTRAKSLPIPAFQLFATLPMSASVTRSVLGSTGLTRVATCATTLRPPATQWPAVPMYFEAPSVKTKFSVQPWGAIMHPPAETAVAETGEADGGEVPRQLTSSCCCGESATWTPSGPAATTRASSSSVNQLGRGWASVVTSELVASSVVAAAATPAVEARAAARAGTATSFCIWFP